MSRGKYKEKEHSMFRIAGESLHTLGLLQELLGLVSRTETLRYAIEQTFSRELARMEKETEEEEE